MTLENIVNDRPLFKRAGLVVSGLLLSLFMKSSDTPEPPAQPLLHLSKGEITELSRRLELIEKEGLCPFYKIKMPCEMKIESNHSGTAQTLPSFRPEDL